MPMTHDPAEALRKIADEIFERWDKDQRSGKLLTALAGRLPGYRADVDAVLAALASPAPAGGEVASLDERMKAVGMIPLSDLLAGNSLLEKWTAHTSVRDLESFEQWLMMKHRQFMTMCVRYELGDKDKKDELFEWVFAHAATFGEVVSNFRAMKERSAADAVTPPPSPDVAGVVGAIRAALKAKNPADSWGHLITINRQNLEQAATLLESLSREREEMKARVQTLEARLEVDHAFKLVNGKLERFEIPPEDRATFPDGIDCRDETIKLLEEQAATRSAEVEKLREALERISEATPQSTNTVSAEGAFSYARAVARTALEPRP